MNPIWIILIHFILYGAPIFLLLLFSPKNRILFNYMYLGVLFILTQLFGRTYSIILSPNLLITGGNLAYSAFLAAYMIVIFSIPDPRKIRNLLYMLIILSLFISLIYVMVSYFLKMEQIDNLFNISDEFFTQSFGSNLVSIISFTIELFGLLFLLELVKRTFKKRFMIILGSIGCYYFMLILDGILFPLGMRIFYPTLEIPILSGIIVKIICGSGFFVLLGIYFTLFYANIIKYIETPLSVRSMFLSKSQLIEKLQKTEEEVKKLQDILPICAKCKKIRDDEGFWNQVEEYLATRSNIRFSHGLCPECAEDLLSDFENNEK
ncbi:MAG: hypothetical protein ACTSUT_04970 [Promethearchaeota archaeon]